MLLSLYFYFKYNKKDTIIGIFVNQEGLLSYGIIGLMRSPSRPASGPPCKLLHFLQFPCTISLGCAPRLTHKKLHRKQEEAMTSLKPQSLLLDSDNPHDDHFWVAGLCYLTTCL
jgi:hypothetical protein